MNKKFALLFLFPIAIFADFYLSICAIFRDESPYFIEWIEFHKLQGVEHFYLYNNNSKDNYSEVLQRYIEIDEITLIDWPHKYQNGDLDAWLSIQRNAYMHCISNYGKTTNWLAVLDIDEFLFSPSGKPLPVILADYEEFGGVCVNWRLFGTSDIENIPPGVLMIELLNRCNLTNDKLNKRIKSIVHPKQVLSCKNPHSFLYKEDFYAVDTSKNKIEKRLDSDQIHYDQLQINHYWTRSKSYFFSQKIESRITRGLGMEKDLLERADACNMDNDDSIFQFIPTLKQNLLRLEIGNF